MSIHRTGLLPVKFRKNESASVVGWLVRSKREAIQEKTSPCTLLHFEDRNKKLGAGGKHLD